MFTHLLSRRGCRTLCGLSIEGREIVEEDPTCRMCKRKSEEAKQKEESRERRMI